MRGRRRLPIRMSGFLIAYLWVVAFLGVVRGAVAAPVVSVFPIPGSQVAPESAQITFRGLPVGQLGTIVVTGSHSGPHAGRLESDSDGQGASFLPLKPFAAGELVTVQTQLNIPGASAGMFSFRVATPAKYPPPLHWGYPPRVANDVWHFHTRPELRPAAVSIDRRGGGVGGYVFLGSQFGPVQDGPEILDRWGNVVWFKRVHGDDSASDFRVQRYQGHDVLTWWQGYSNGGVGVGTDVIVNSAYQTVAHVLAGNGLKADLHEFLITPWNTALITAEHPVFWNTASVGGPQRQVVLDAVVQEIDIPTGLVLFEWDSLDHVPVTDTYSVLPSHAGDEFDYFHVNSVDVDRDGTLLISSRNTWAIYKVDRSSGGIIWTLGGKHSSFRLEARASFAYQHDVRVRSSHDSYITLFDDGGGPARVHKSSRGLELFLDANRKLATVVGQEKHVPALASNYEGNDQQLGQGHTFLGWGSQPYFTEYDSHGHEVFDGRFISATSSYRAYRFNWSGTPHTRPAISVVGSGRNEYVYVSWNGATKVARWRVETGASMGSLHAVTTVWHNGFETSIRIDGGRYVRAQALDAEGHLLASSRTISVR